MSASASKLALPNKKAGQTLSGRLCDPSGLFSNIDFQLFMKILDHFVDLEPKNWAILIAFYMGKSVFTKVGYSEV